ncbi:putative nucleolar MIF4G domain-containing protein 1-like [Trypanosoma theileri]|uniref:Putative nucleolar MIF4G domain-containing protein 1-like n=1 Tax=Trypanosoma theileri TaxID=67003 RepID=A0A1X0P271_9TRYP|nr:putative nucleolar MIF4G domain-containing protein 1-like [Trypanosoma theileri]ORC90951.1 putative nucleolar MIF4G domain-containing protein 1-like [Trypanosoma theileri]
MEAPFRRRGRKEEEEVDEFDRQRDRKQRRREERQARKRQRIEAHEKWVEQRRNMKENAQMERRSKQQRTDSTQRKQTRKTNTNTNSTISSSSSSSSSSSRITPPMKKESKGSVTVGNEVKKEKKQQQQQQQKNNKKNNKKEGEELNTVVPETTSVEVPSTKYIPPSLRRKIQPETNTALDEITRRVINKLTVRNVADMTREISDLFSGSVEGATRASVLHSLAQHINRMCMLDAGLLTPIGSLPFAGLIRGLQLLHGNVVGAELIESLCLALQGHLKKNNETGVSNGAMVLAHLYILNAVDSVLISSFLRSVLKIGGDGAVCAVACGLTLLRACGEKLLKEAPAQMEMALTEAKKYGRKQPQGTNRYTALLSYIAEIVTGHTRSAKRTVDEEDLPIDTLLNDMSTLLPGGSSGGGSNSMNNKRVALRVMSTTSVLTGMTWTRMLHTDKPPRWFTPNAWSQYEDEEKENNKGKNNKESSSFSSSEVSSSSSSSNSDKDEDSDTEEDEAELKAERIRQMRQKEKAISGQRFNTENKREVFECIANASDDLEAFTLLIHRDTSFSRLHDTLSVLLQCCYQEKTYNPYYTQIIQRFCSAKTSCKNTLQFALWDMFKVIRVEAVDVTGYLNLSCLLTSLIEMDIFTLSVLRGLDLESTNRTMGLFTRILLLRMILQLPPVKLTEVFFGGDGFRAHDVKIDTRILRSNLAKLVERYFVDERESAKWIPHFYDVVAVGTSFDVLLKKKNKNNNNNNNDGIIDNHREESMEDEEAQLQAFMKRIRVVFKALKSGIS